MAAKNDNSYDTFQSIHKRLDALEAKTQTIIDRLEYLDANADLIGQQPLSTKQASKILGLKVPTIYLKVAKGQIPHMKLGNRTYFFESQLLLWLENKHISTKRRMYKQKRKPYKPPSNDTLKTIFGAE